MRSSPDTTTSMSAPSRKRAFITSSPELAARRDEAASISRVLSVRRASTKIIISCSWKWSTVRSAFKLSAKPARSLTAASFCRCDRVHLDRSGLGVQRACDRDLFTRELFRRLLVAQLVGFFAVIQNILCAVRADAGDGALGVRRSHSHSGMVACGAHVVRNGAGERALRLR